MTNQTNEIIILTGRTGSGKTTALDNWLCDANDVDGILTLNINGKRYLKFLSDEKIIPLDSAKDEESLLIGKYSFSKEAFNLANDYLIKMNLSKINFIIIDEVGPLELNGKGFDKAIRYLLQKTTPRNKLLMVIREKILHKAIVHYNVDKNNLKIISAESLSHITSI